MVGHLGSQGRRLLGRSGPARKDVGAPGLVEQDVGYREPTGAPRLAGLERCRGQ